MGNLGLSKKKIRCMILASILNAISALHEAVTEDFTILSIFWYFHAACQFIACLGLWYLWYQDEDESRYDLDQEGKKLE